MTNYSKWDKFDPDLVCKEIEVQQAVESSKLARKKVFQAVASENEQSVLEAKRNAEALQSQADVAALKARGMGGRRKAKAKDAESPNPADSSTNPAILPPPAPAPPNARSLADKLHAVTDFLFRLLKQVEQIRVCTEKKSSHCEGYTACVQCLQDIHIFSRIKNATVMAALRASGGGGGGDTGGDEGGSGVPDTTVKIIEDLNESESFLIEQTVNCLSLFALSRGEFALSAECSRFVLKRQGSVADAGIWIMRGLALAAMGVPYLAKLYFASAATANNDYLGLRECAEEVDQEVRTHARLTVKASKQELITRELARTLRSHFQPTTHLLHTTPDLAVLTVAEVKDQAMQVLVVQAGLEMIRKLFYEAQVLYLENIYQTAEVKYCAVILLINSIKTTVNTLICDTRSSAGGSNGVSIGGGGSGSGCGGVMKWGDVLSYLDNVLTTCYVNIGCSMVHHSVRLRMIGTTNSTSTGTATTSTSTTTTTNTTALSVNDLVGSSLHSVLYTPLHYIDTGLRVCDTVSGRFRKLYVLEKMHRFKEGLEECEHILNILNNNLLSIYTGMHVAHTLSTSSLGQEYMAGFVLPMPVASVLGGSGGVGGSGSGSGSGSSGVVCIDDSVGVDADLDREFDMLFHSATTSTTTTNASGGGAGVLHTTSHAPSDAVVQAQVWRTQLQKKMNTFEFLIRKHGLQ